LKVTPILQECYRIKTPDFFALLASVIVVPWFNSLNPQRG
jgi:hypothetical protein